MDPHRSEHLLGICSSIRQQSETGNDWGRKRFADLSGPQSLKPSSKAAYRRTIVFNVELFFVLEVPDQSVHRAGAVIPA